MRPSLWLLPVLLLNACSRESPAPVDEAKSSVAVKNEAAGLSAGIDHETLSSTIKAGDNFDDYVNGNWRAATEIPADRSSVGVSYEVFKKAEQRTAELIQKAGESGAAEGSNQRKIADYYAAYMDEAAIESKGLQALADVFAQIDGIKTNADLASVIGSTLRADTDPLNATNLYTENLFGVFVAQSLDNPQVQVAYLMQGGLGLPDRDYYLSQDEPMPATRKAYRDYIEKLLALSGDKNASANAGQIFALEESIAKVHASVTESSDVHKSNNPWQTSMFAKNAPGIEWDSFFKAAGLDKEKVITAWQPDAIRGIAALVGKQSVALWKTYLRFHAINSNAHLLPKAYDDLQFDFYGRTLRGRQEQRARWKRAVAATSSGLADAVGQIYVEKYFPPSSKAQVEAMVANINAAFVERVDALTWMTVETRAKAKAKAQKTRVSVGYPETWRDYGSLHIRRDDALGNKLRAELFEYKHQLAKLGKPVDRGEWWMSPQTVNAVNLPLQNAMNFPAAILEPPFFDASADAAANYGSIGSVIGHEISHSFDNIGAEFDAEGRLLNWWTAEDSEHFKAASEKLVKQYNAYEPFPGLHINGEQTLAENIADVSGLTIAYNAYRKSLNGKEAPVINGLTGDQRFFIAFGQAWRTKDREKSMREQIVTDGHAPDQYRAQTVRNIDAWYDAFFVQPDQKLYLAPEDRVKIW